MKSKKMPLADIVFVLVILIMVLFFAWNVFGQSLTLDQLMMVLTILFLGLAFESRQDTKQLRDSILVSNKYHIEQIDILKDIRSVIK